MATLTKPTNGENAGAAFFIARQESLADWPAARIAVLRSKFSYVLVSTREQHTAAVRLGLQPILLSLSFSETDQRGSLRVKLGALLASWRWRRVLMNEGIGSVVAQLGEGTLALLAGATLAGTRWQVTR